MRIFITGGAGYIGSMLIARFLADDTVTAVISLDLLPRPARLTTHPKLIWLTADLATAGWEQRVLSNGRPDLVIHCAFKIRNPFGRIRQNARHNLTACENTFRFCLINRVPKLIYLSSVAAYGARRENIGRLLQETDSLTENRSPYGRQKKLVEENLQQLYRTVGVSTATIILRLNSITGPYGQKLKSKFGLVAGLKKLAPLIPQAHPAWARQFVHEDDLVDAILKLARPSFVPASNLDVFNVAPPAFLTAANIARLLRKHTLPVPPGIMRAAFAILWPLSLGFLPTPPGSADGFIYPINVDGSKLTAATDFNYRYTSAEALLAQTGRYAILKQKS